MSGSEYVPPSGSAFRFNIIATLDRERKRQFKGTAKLDDGQRISMEDYLFAFLRTLRHEGQLDGVRSLKISISQNAAGQTPAAHKETV